MYFVQSVYANVGSESIWEKNNIKIHKIIELLFMYKIFQAVYIRLFGCRSGLYSKIPPKIKKKKKTNK